MSTLPVSGSVFVIFLLRKGPVFSISAVFNISLMAFYFYMNPTCFFFTKMRKSGGSTPGSAAKPSQTYMRKILLLIPALLFMLLGYSQTDDRRPLRGQVLYRSVPVPNENVINTTAERATITNDNGEFLIYVKEGDELVFTAVNYQIEILKVTAEILKRNRLVVEVNEKVTELDEVTVSPENQKKFLQLQNEEFKEYVYETDATSEFRNIAQDQAGVEMRDGLNFVNLFKALFLSGDKDSGLEREPLKVSEVLRQVYDDDFFVRDLQLPQDKIDAFLLYCDSRLPAQSLLRKDNEFELIEFLVNQSKEFRKGLDVEE